MHTFRKPNAIACIRGGEEAPCLSGAVRLYQYCGYVLVEVHVSGLPKSESGFFALHIHEGDSCAGEAFSATGGHYDPADQPHPLHAGDLPPLLSCGERAYLAVRTDRFCVREVIGRTLVIHSHGDDFRSQPAEAAGTKIACGVIRSV